MAIMWRSTMRKGRAAAIILLCLGVCMLWADALWQAQTLAAQYDGVSVRIADAPVAHARLRALRSEEEQAGLTCTAAWTRGEKAMAAAASMGTEAKLRVIAVYGDMRQVTPMTLLSGGFPAEDDADGCLMDAVSAQTLFHSVDVAGTKVTVGEVSYTVRGVVKGGEPMLLVRNAEAAYENLEFAPAVLENGKAEAEAFLRRHALSEDYIVVQNGLYARIAKGLVWLPVELSLLVAFVRLLRAALCAYVQQGRRRAALRLLGAAGRGTLAGLLLIKTFFWPQAFLPTKLSDFAFWDTLTATWRSEWEAIGLMTPLPKDVRFFRAMRACVCRVAGIMVLETCLCVLISMAGGREKKRLKEEEYA